MQAFLNNIVTLQRSNPSVQFKYETANVTITPKEPTSMSNEIAPYNGAMVDCKTMCYCAYCSEACNLNPELVPDYSCRIGTLPCWLTATIVGSVLAAAVLVSVLFAIAQRIVNWYRNVNAVPEARPLTNPFHESTSLLH